MLHIIVYGKEGCCLCSKAADMVKELSREYPLILEEVDITKDEALYTLYRYEIPVVKIDGEVKFKGKVARLWLERAIRAALSQP